MDQREAMARIGEAMQRIPMHANDILDRPHEVETAVLAAYLLTTLVVQQNQDIEYVLNIIQAGGELDFPDDAKPHIGPLQRHLRESEKRRAELAELLTPLLEMER